MGTRGFRYLRMFVMLATCALRKKEIHVAITMPSSVVLDSDIFSAQAVRPA
jgi:hypothetical protein